MLISPQRSSDQDSHDLGYSLIELLIVLLIMGILATAVLPSLQSHIRSARRNEAISHLLQLKIQQERFRLNHHSYASTQQLVLPHNPYYAFSVTGETASTFTLIATPLGTQRADSRCQTLSINQSMQQQPTECFVH
jgi:type IV pilus assembly protein PilE